MKRTHFISLLLVGACTWFGVACSKKYKHPDSVQPNTINPFGGQPNLPTVGAELNKLFKDLRSTPERQCVTAGVLQVVTFAKGTRLTFYPNSFKDKAGKIITSGTVCIEMIEMYKPGDMIANRATTMSDKGLLQSGGQVYINATKDGQEVFANKYGIAFKQNAASAEPMDLYVGNTQNPDSVVTWTLIPETTVAGTTPDTGGVVPVYVFDSCTSFRSENCDKLYKRQGPKATFAIYVPTLSKVMYTQIFIVIPKINGVIFRVVGPSADSIIVPEASVGMELIPIRHLIKAIFIQLPRGD